MYYVDLGHITYMPHSQFLAFCWQGSHFSQVDDTEKEQGDMQNELPIRQDIHVQI